MPTPYTPSQLETYLDSLVPPRPAEMLSMERTARETDFPIVGPASGQFCYLIARLSGARRVFELGSGYGYSTSWFARAVKENGGGVVYHVVWKEDLSQRARHHLNELGYDGLIEYRVAEAVQTLRETDGLFDLIFNDIDKEGYPEEPAGDLRKAAPGRRADRRQPALARAGARPRRSPAQHRSHPRLHPPDHHLARLDHLDHPHPRRADAGV